MTDPTNSLFEDDPFGAIKDDKKSNTPDARSVNAFHHRDDLDSGPTAHHHTIGLGRNQAPPGDHVHDGISSRKIGSGLNLSVSGSTAGNVALQNLLTMLADVIDFTDTTT